MKWIRVDEEKPPHIEGITILAKWLKAYVREGCIGNRNTIYSIDNCYQVLIYHKELGWLKENKDGVSEDFDQWKLLAYGKEDETQ